MKKKLKIDLLTGLGFAGVSFGVVKLLDFTQTSYMILAYLYIFLAGFLALRHEVSRMGGLGSIMDRFMLVVDEEEKKLKRVFSGEKYRMKGELEKLS